MQLNPEGFETIYPSPTSLQPGLNVLTKMYTRKNINTLHSAIRYALTLMQVEKQLNRHPEMLTTIRRGVEHFSAHFFIDDVWDDTVTYERLAHLYTETASKLRLRVLVNGNPNVMKSELNIARTRTCLLAGIRATMLWRQVGGRRWHIILGRKRMLKGIQIVTTFFPTLH